MLNWLACRRCGSLTLDSDAHAKQSAAGSFEFVLGFERLHCQVLPFRNTYRTARTRACRVETRLDTCPGVMQTQNQASSRVLDGHARVRMPHHTSSAPAPPRFRLSFFPAFPRFSINSFASMSTSLRS